MAENDSGCEDKDSLVGDDEDAARKLDKEATNAWYEVSKKKRNLVRRRTLSDSLIDLGSLRMKRSKYDDKEVMSEDDMHVETVVTAETRAKIDEYVEPNYSNPVVVEQTTDVSMESDDDALNVTADTVVMEDLAEATSEPASVSTEEPIEVSNGEVDFNNIERHPDYKKVEFYHGSKRARLFVILNNLFDDDE